MRDDLRRSALGRHLDGIGLRALMLCVSVGWFVFLWGLRLPALAAGAGLYGLLMLLYRRTRADRLLRREARLRRQVGGELALERLIALPAAQAHFEAALRLSLRYGLELLRMDEQGVLCRRGGETLLIAFAQLPLSDQAQARDVLSLQQAARELGAERAVLCVPCGVNPRAQAQAETGLPVTLLGREWLARLFGAQSPATNAQLVALGRRRKKRPPMGAFLRQMLDRGRWPRYALYGGLLLGLYLLTGLGYYAVPGLCCLALAVACRCVRTAAETI